MLTALRTCFKNGFSSRTEAGWSALHYPELKPYLEAASGRLRRLLVEEQAWRPEQKREK